MSVARASARAEVPIPHACVACVAMPVTCGFHFAAMFLAFTDSGVRGTIPPLFHFHAGLWVRFHPDSSPTVGAASSVLAVRTRVNGRPKHITGRSFITSKERLT